ncbi:hypothetical protein HMPREF0201_02670 [Cedecea davisae DSM 4568]|uniref:Uncharacterized protein n=1 Tax=Cedecea davisae DSM 4568 TaxID=566551 RepID=S3IRA4_9ENTR|nr:hypothetical protein HMPREF0201_02670 [Cedecea davisae DSM 4568]
MGKETGREYNVICRPTSAKALPAAFAIIIDGTVNNHSRIPGAFGVLVSGRERGRLRAF